VTLLQTATLPVSLVNEKLQLDLDNLKCFAADSSLMSSEIEKNSKELSKMNATRHSSIVLEESKDGTSQVFSNLKGFLIVFSFA
jgi:hypothetical protein